MIDVNWDLAPEGAEKIIQYNDTLTWAKEGYYWRIASDKWEKDDCANENIVLATRPAQTKTVADAVEAFPDGFPETLDLPKVDDWWFNSNGGLVWVYELGGLIKHDLVCTRAEFEAYVKEQEKPQPHFKATRENLEKIAKDAQGDFVEVEQEGEKWTHRYNELKCRTLISEPDREGYIVIVNELNEYYCVDDEELKLIKPRISEDAKRQLELYVQYRIDKYGDYVMKSDLSDYLSHHDII